MHSSVHNFNKYNESHFNEISSTQFKFDTINKFYKNLIKLDYVKSENENRKHKK